MSDEAKNVVPPSDRAEDIPRALRAMREAAQDALRRHKLAGRPVAVWRDGRVVWVQPQDIPVSIELPSRE